MRTAFASVDPEGSAHELIDIAEKVCRVSVLSLDPETGAYVATTPQLERDDRELYDLRSKSRKLLLGVTSWPERLENIFSEYGVPASDAREVVEKLMADFRGLFLVDPDPIEHHDFWDRYKRCGQSLAAFTKLAEGVRGRHSVRKFSKVVVAEKPTSSAADDSAFVAAKALRDPETQLAKRFEQAYHAYKWAEQQFLNLNADSTEVSDEAAWEHLKLQGFEGYTPPPEFGTWQRYVRMGREFYDDRKNTRRVGRAGRSIVREGETDAPKQSK